MHTQLFYILGLCVMSMLMAATVNILYGADRLPPKWVDQWFFLSVLAGVWVLVAYAVWRVVGAE